MYCSAKWSNQLTPHSDGVSVCLSVCAATMLHHTPTCRGRAAPHQRWSSTCVIRQQMPHKLLHVQRHLRHKQLAEVCDALTPWAVSYNPQGNKQAVLHGSRQLAAIRTSFASSAVASWPTRLVPVVVVQQRTACWKRKIPRLIDPLLAMSRIVQRQRFWALSPLLTHLPHSPHPSLFQTHLGLLQTAQPPGEWRACKV